MEYPKINSLWKRQGWYFDEHKKKDPAYQSTRQSFIIGDYSEAAFGNIKKWLVDEKIDGTNVRIIWQRPEIGAFHELSFAGRTDDAAMSPHLLKRLQELFKPEIFIEQFFEAERVILFGEGYGPKIQAGGGNYSASVDFILFDIFVDGWWLKREDVKIIAEKIGLKVVPEIGLLTEEQIVAFIKSKPLSTCSRVPQVMEGVVCREPHGLRLRNKQPVMWKLKTKEIL